MSEEDPSVKVAKMALPAIVYIPIITAILLVAGFLGIKLSQIANSPGGLAGYFNKVFSFFTGMKLKFNEFVDFIWPDENSNIAEKTYQHRRIDTMLIGLGGAFIFLMIVLYNFDKFSMGTNKIKNLLIKLFNPILNFFMPHKWNKMKRNMSLKETTTPPITFKDYPMLLGGTALLLGFVVFMSLLVNNFNKDVTNATPGELTSKLMEKTSYYLYMSVFMIVVLAFFAGLLYYAATTDSAPKYLSTLLLVLSTVIILASVVVFFKKKIFELIKNPFLRIIYHVLFMIPCLFLDLVNFIYYELKYTPRVVYGIFIAEIVLILSFFVLPILTKATYLNKFTDIEKSRKLDVRVENLKEKKIKLEKKINEIYNFDPVNSEPGLITLSSKVPNEKYTRDTITITVEKEIKDYEDLDNFCMSTQRPGDKKTVLMKGELNIYNNKIKWKSIKTLSGWATKYSSEIMKKKCVWTRKMKKDDSEWIKKYLGVGNKKPDKIDVPMTAKELNKVYPTNRFNEVREQIIKKKRKNQMEGNDVKEPGEYIMSILNNANDIFKKSIENPDINRFLNVSNSVNTDAWKKILKKNLDNPDNEYQLIQLLRGIGFKTEKDCENLKDNYLIKKCEKEMENMIKHVQFNTKQIILFKNEIDEADERLKFIGEYKKKNGGILEKGVILLNKATYFSNERNILTDEFKKKKIIDGTVYNYSVSCWFFIHSQAPNTSEAYNRFSKILDFNGEPIIGYNARNNKLIIKTSKVKIDSAKIENEEVVIHKEEKFKLQKWHNIVVNYVGGTVDIFLNGKLVSNMERIVPFKRLERLKVGEDSGISGGIANVVYYASYLSKSKIKGNYNLYKNKNPPEV